MSRLAGVSASLVRVALAAAVLLLCWGDREAMLARDGFDALPEFDHRAEAESLLAERRHSEAMLVAEAGIAAGSAQRAELQALAARIQQDEAQFWSKLHRVGAGALTGTGDTVEELGGAVVADLFVFGDVRDLVIQSGRGLRGEPVDEVIVGLSAAGLALTAAPAADLGAALLKFARRVGALGDRFASHLIRAIRRAPADGADELKTLANNTALLARRMRPAPALRVLKHVDDPAELRAVTRFSGRSDGALALWLGERQAVRWVAAGAGGEALALKAAKRGRAGFSYLADHGPVLLRMHPLLGLVKGFWKGNIPELLVELMRRYSVVALGLAAGWLAYEVLLLLARLAAPGLRPRPAPSSSG